MKDRQRPGLAAG